MAWASMDGSYLENVSGLTVFRADNAGKVVYLDDLDWDDDIDDGGDNDNDDNDDSKGKGESQGEG